MKGASATSARAATPPQQRHRLRPRVAAKARQRDMRAKAAARQIDPRAAHLTLNAGMQIGQGRATIGADIDRAGGVGIGQIKPGQTHRERGNMKHLQPQMQRV